MNLLKKAIFACGTVMMLFVGGSVSFAQEPVGQAPVDLRSPFENPEAPSDLNVPKDPNVTLIGGVKKVINYFLGLLSLIALIMMLYAGFKMLTAGGDSKKYDEGFTVAKQTAVGLLFIGASWLIVSFIFWVVKVFTSGT